MAESDPYILEFLHNEGTPIRATPRVIAANIDYQPGTVRSRVGALRESELIEYYDKKSALYEITDLGMRYLNGELSDEEIEEIEESLGSSDESDEETDGE